MMKRIPEIYLLIFFLFFSFYLSAQCNFQYISNDTVFQDYIDLVYASKSSDEIITIGSRTDRGIVNDSVFIAPVFQLFDYCGTTLRKMVYKYIGNNQLRHQLVPNNNIYTEEPIGNTAIAINDDEFLIVDKAVDTLMKKFVLVLFNLNKNGELKTFNSLNLTTQEWNQTGIKNVLKLKDGKLLVILTGYLSVYNFYYFDENLNLILKKSLSLARGIRAIKEIDNGEFVSTSIADANASFQFYRFDTSGSGSIKWMVTPYNILGSARDIMVDNNKLFLVGGTGLFGLFLICDLDGNILKEFKYDTFFCNQYFCSAYIDSENSIIIGGYIQHCLPNDSSATDIAILKIDTSGEILYNKLYSFRNTLGTTGSQGKFTDFGGFVINKTNDGGFVTNGKSKYSKLNSGGLLHENALLIKTGPFIVSNLDIQDKDINPNFNLLGNLLNIDLNVIGRIELIKKWTIYYIDGKIIKYGKQWKGTLDIRNFVPGLYNIQVIDQYNCQYFLKFVKM